MQEFPSGQTIKRLSSALALAGCWFRTLASRWMWIPGTLGTRMGAALWVEVAHWSTHGLAGGLARDWCPHGSKYLRSALGEPKARPKACDSGRSNWTKSGSLRAEEASCLLFVNEASFEEGVRNCYDPAGQIAGAHPGGCRAAARCAGVLGGQ